MSTPVTTTPPAASTPILTILNPTAPLTSSTDNLKRVGAYFLFGLLIGRL